MSKSEQIQLLNKQTKHNKRSLKIDKDLYDK